MKGHVWLGFRLFGLRVIIVPGLGSQLPVDTLALQRSSFSCLTFFWQGSDKKEATSATRELQWSID